MSNYEPITFGKLSEAIAYLEDGGEILYREKMIFDVHELASVWDDGVRTFYTKAKRATWQERLDGTVENGVLCRLDDCKEILTVLIIAFDGQFYLDEIGSYWSSATPLTRAEIQRFMDNAPEEV